MGKKTRMTKLEKSGKNCKKTRNRANSLKAILKSHKASDSLTSRMKRKKDQEKRKSKTTGRLTKKACMTSAEVDLEKSIQLLLVDDNAQRAAAEAAYAQAKKTRAEALQQLLTGLQQKTKIAQVKTMCGVLLQDMSSLKPKGEPEVDGMDDEGDDVDNEAEDSLAPADELNLRKKAKQIKNKLKF